MGIQKRLRPYILQQLFFCYKTGNGNAPIK